MKLTEEQKWDNFVKFTEKRVQNAALPDGESGCRAGCWWSYDDYATLFKCIYNNDSIEFMAVQLQRSRSSIEVKMTSLGVAIQADIKNRLSKVFNKKLIWQPSFNIHRMNLPKHINKYKIQKLIIDIGFKPIYSNYSKGIFEIPQREQLVVIGKFISAKERKNQP